MINCEVFSHVYFATLPIPRCCGILDLLSKFCFRAEIGLNINGRLGVCDSGLGVGSGVEMFTTLGFRVICILTDVCSFSSWQILT